MQFKHSTPTTCSAVRCSGVRTKLTAKDDRWSKMFPVAVEDSGLLICCICACMMDFGLILHLCGTEHGLEADIWQVAFVRLLPVSMFLSAVLLLAPCFSSVSLNLVCLAFLLVWTCLPHLSLG